MFRTFIFLLHGRVNLLRDNVLVVDASGVGAAAVGAVVDSGVSAAVGSPVNTNGVSTADVREATESAVVASVVGAAVKGATSASNEYAAVHGADVTGVISVGGGELRHQRAFDFGSNGLRP